MYLHCTAGYCPITTDKPDSVIVPWIQMEMICISKCLQMLIRIQAVRQLCNVYV